MLAGALGDGIALVGDVGKDGAPRGPFSNSASKTSRCAGRRFASQRSIFCRPTWAWQVATSCTEALRTSTLELLNQSMASVMV